MLDDLLPVVKRGGLALCRQPVVELGQPVLDSVDGDDAEDGPPHRVGQEHVDEGHQLHGFTFGEKKYIINNQESCFW